MIVNVSGYRVNVSDADRVNGNAARFVNEILFGKAPVTRIHG